MAAALTILICTHNREDLLERVLASINAAKRPAIPVKILVAANACSDGTVLRMQAYQARQIESDLLPLECIEVPTPGKSHALNRAIPLIDTELTAFVDDDHRVDENYLCAIEHMTQTWPEAGLYCGRILPDWDGSEPDWVHDEGPYRIYPLPVPRYDQGDCPKVITAQDGPIPGGGNLVVRKSVFQLTGQFSTELGPHGHDLGGGEDSEYVLRAMTRGVLCQYYQGMVQYHFVDTERLRLSYLIKKSYQRTRSTCRIHGTGHVPLYMWRKLAGYLVNSTFSLSWAKRRFYWMRTAAALGEIRGSSESGHRRNTLALPLDVGIIFTAIIALVSACCGLVAWNFSGEAKWEGLVPAISMAAVGSALLLIKSLTSFSQTGPSIRDEILSHFRSYTLYALARLGTWSFAIMLFTGGAGVLVYFMLATATQTEWSFAFALLAASIGIVGSVALQFVTKLRFNPGLLVASMHYRTSRLYRLWRWGTPETITRIKVLLLAGFVLLVIVASWQLVREQRIADLISMLAAVQFIAGIAFLAAWQPKPRPPAKVSAQRSDSMPNIVMIGSDTLRADRLGAMGNWRALTPNIDQIAARGAFFANCYVPCARTAPSLISLLTGTWPHTHGIRDNFVADSETRLKHDSLPQLLKARGYRTAAISDWCGADMGKFSFGFEHTDLPDDQWNLKYLIRQGPKDLRLYLSLFTHNRLGRLLLPEIYYLGGVPLTQPMGKRARRLVSRLTENGAPFFLNVFYSTTHPPFASEWPWYVRFADPAYLGESKFAMARLTDPLEILRRQGAPKEEFDLDQILDLYDGCVAEFDDEVGKMLAHLEQCGIANNTILVVYSDHGMELFEHDSWGQGNSAVGEASPRIPLVIHDPHLPAIGRIDSIVRSIDLAPTLLELVDAPQSAGMDGVSLAKCLRGNAPCPELEAFNETGIWIADIPGMPEEHLRYPNLLELIDVPDRGKGTLAIKEKYNADILNAKDRMLRSGRWKLVYQPLSDGPGLRLYDLETDAACRCDLAVVYPDVRERLWLILKMMIDSGSLPFRMEL